jgi:hypothetical protein
MFLRRISLTFIVAASTISPCVFAQGGATTTTRSITIGPVGVGSTEAVQLNLANIAANGSDGTMASCTGSIVFNNSTGSAIQVSAGELSSNFSVNSGQITSVTVPFALMGASSLRATVIAVISLNTTSPPQVPCNLRYSLETYDTATGATHAFVSGGAAGGQFGGAPFAGAAGQ